MTYLDAYLTVIATLVVVDVVWLGIVTPRFSRPTLGDILTHGANLPPAIVFHVLYDRAFGLRHQAGL